MGESYDGIRALADLFASLKYPTATKVELEFGGMVARRRGGSVVSDGLSWLWCWFCHAVRVQFGVGMLRAKALAGVAGGMTAASLTLLSRWGRHFWVHGVLWVKTLSSEER